jgi:cell division protein FtsW
MQVSNGLSRRQWVLLFSVVLSVVGVVMVGSASMDMAALTYKSPFYFVHRQMIFLVAGLVCAALVYQVPLAVWERISVPLLLAAYALLMLVLIPGIGRTVNGSTRWIVAGPINIQVSEIVKICAMMYVAGYLVRRSDEVRERFSGFIKPMLLLSVMVAFLMKQPDFGAVVVIMVSVLVMLFLGGVKFGQFLLVLLGSIGAGALMVFSSSYRMKRVLGYIDPWAEQYASGYQLVQSLIAFGRGEWTGVGLGNGIQKLFYLPEAHTDFVFAVMAEEFGLIGNLLVLGVFMALVFTGLSIGRAAERQGKRFNGYLVYGLSVMLGMQALVNMGVSSGLLPTKGLTLPLISYGGSSLIIVCVVLALIMRADFENSQHLKKSPSKQPNLNLEVTG